MTEKLFLDDGMMREFDATVTAVTPTGIVLDKTAFYANSGGQPGDIGMIDSIPVTDTVKDKENPTQIIHVVADPNQFSVGQTVHGVIDWNRRWNHMRMHTTLHLLCALIKGDVTGGAVGAEKGRLDFNIENGALDKDILTKQLNDIINGGHAVSTNYIDEEELDRNPDMVRTLSVKPPRGSGKIRMVTIGQTQSPVDRQPCGGTHVPNTRDIGAVTVTKIENKGKMNKRIILVFNEFLEQQVAA